MKKIIRYLLSDRKIKNLIYKFFCILGFLLFRNKYGRAISKMYTSFRYPHRALIQGCEFKYNTHIASNRLQHMEDI
jgi:hypothetical protein